jgi:hypothetical protein
MPLRPQRLQPFDRLSRPLHAGCSPRAPELPDTVGRSAGRAQVVVSVSALKSVDRIARQHGSNGRIVGAPGAGAMAARWRLARRKPCSACTPARKHVDAIVAIVHQNLRSPCRAVRAGPIMRVACGRNGIGPQRPSSAATTFGPQQV